MVVEKIDAGHPLPESVSCLPVPLFELSALRRRGSGCSIVFRESEHCAIERVREGEKREERERADMRHACKYKAVLKRASLCIVAHSATVHSCGLGRHADLLGQVSVHMSHVPYNVPHVGDRPSP